MPAAIRIAKGTHMERLNRNEPQPPSDNIAAPPWVTGTALERFTELAPQLVGIGVMTNIDTDVLGRYCVIEVEWRKHLAICQRGGDVLVLKDESGRVRFASVAPSASLVSKYGTMLLRLAQELGMSPASRTQVAAKAVPPSDPLREWLKRYDTPAPAVGGRA